MSVTTEKTYGDLKDGDTVFVQGIPMEVSNLHMQQLEGGQAVRFTGTFDEKKHGWARGYSGRTYGAYPSVPCLVVMRRDKAKAKKPRLTR